MVAYYKTGKISHKKGQGTGGKRGRPRGTKKLDSVRHFTAKDAGRCVAYARHYGADDALLARYLIYAFGIGKTPFILAQIALITANVILYGVIFKLLRGLKYFYKGVKLWHEANAAGFMGELFHEAIAVIELETDIEVSTAMHSLTKGSWMMWMGGIQAGIASAIMFFDSFAGTIIYWRFIDIVAAKVIPDKPFKITPKPFIKL